MSGTGSWILLQGLLLNKGSLEVIYLDKYLENWSYQDRMKLMNSQSQSLQLRSGQLRTEAGCASQLAQAGMETKTQLQQLHHMKDLIVSHKNCK